MPKTKGKSSLISPMGPAFNKPNPGGDFDTGISFDSKPTEQVSGHNVYETEHTTHTGTKTLKTPMKKVRPVKVDE